MKKSTMQAYSDSQLNFVTITLYSIGVYVVFIFYQFDLNLWILKSYSPERLALKKKKKIIHSNNGIKMFSK